MTPIVPESSTTWLFEEGSFVPMAKLKNGKQESILCDHLGTPSQMYDQNGELTWDCQLDIYREEREK